MKNYVGCTFRIGKIEGDTSWKIKCVFVYEDLTETVEQPFGVIFPTRLDAEDYVVSNIRVSLDAYYAMSARNLLDSVPQDIDCELLVNWDPIDSSSNRTLATLKNITLGLRIASGFIVPSGQSLLDLMNDILGG